MGAPKGNQYAKGNNGGSPGYGNIKQILTNIKTYMPEWWTEWKRMLRSKNKEERKVAMQEFNKLQIKVVPTDMNVNVSKSIGDILKDE